MKEELWTSFSSGRSFLKTLYIENEMERKVVYFTSSVAQVVLLTLIYSGNHINDRLVIKSNEGRRKKSKLASECDKMPQVFLSS